VGYYGGTCQDPARRSVTSAERRLSDQGQWQWVWVKASLGALQAVQPYEAGYWFAPLCDGLID
jgi:hypothetical protein